jgi:hypothetical protein
MSPRPEFPSAKAEIRKKSEVRGANGISWSKGKAEFFSIRIGVGFPHSDFGIGAKVPNP